MGCFFFFMICIKCLDTGSFPRGERKLWCFRKHLSTTLWKFVKLLLCQRSLSANERLDSGIGEIEGGPVCPLSYRNNITTHGYISNWIGQDFPSQTLFCVVIPKENKCAVCFLGTVIPAEPTTSARGGSTPREPGSGATSQGNSGQSEQALPEWRLSWER